MTGPGPAVRTVRFAAWAGDSYRTDRSFSVSASERRRELSRRRSRKEKLNKLKSKLAKATQSEKTEIARKLRELTPGAEELIDRWKLVEVDR